MANLHKMNKQTIDLWKADLGSIRTLTQISDLGSIRTLTQISGHLKSASTSYGWPTLALINRNGFIVQTSVLR